MNIILVCGVIGSGKDYFFQKYKREYPEESVVELKFAEPIVRLAENYFDVSLSDKEEYEKWKAIPENRQFLVEIGQSWKKVFGEDVWSNIVYNKINRSYDSVLDLNTTYIVTDFRFPCEIPDNISQKYSNISPYCIKIHFCNFVSERYDNKIGQYTEKMAQWVVSKGFDDGMEWSYEEFISLLKEN